MLLRVSYCSASARIDKSLLCTVWGGRVEAIINLTRSQILPFAGIAGRRKSREPESSKRDQFCLSNAFVGNSGRRTYFDTLGSSLLFCARSRATRTYSGHRQKDKQLLYDKLLMLHAEQTRIRI